MHRVAIFAVVAAVLVAASANAAEPKEVPPAWAKRASGDQLLSFLPAKAAKEGQDGKAVIECDVAVDGNLRNCRVISETPEGYGFGAAALLAAPLFKMKPATVDGKPVVRAARIPINWDLERGVGGKSFDMVTQAVWLEAPTRAEVQAARGGKVATAARVVLNCGFKPDGTLTDCDEKEASEQGAGLTPAARKLLGKFRMAGADKLKDTRILVPFQFDPGGSPGVEDRRLLSKPAWAQRANPAALAFPAAARAAGLSEGRATAECLVGAQGVLVDCHVVSESAANVGFGDTAVAAAALFRASAWTNEGRPVDGARVRIGFQFVDEADEAPAAAPPAPAAKP
ncbi:TonB family protein [Caulobacter sp. 17J65-9]|uniref:TonB family protein n=1 Tax=Caulobacter sp. 17J65-9 TaxID=2709382 RepID=UPI0013C7AEDC|nr:TonB family protein [Caulobacter sp. 17J65-9]NEX93865.1 TonB family protein [Caulobacter sp. 17J65-9]